MSITNGKGMKVAQFAEIGCYCPEIGQQQTAGMNDKWRVIETAGEIVGEEKKKKIYFYDKECRKAMEIKKEAWKNMTKRSPEII